MVTIGDMKGGTCGCGTLFILLLTIIIMFAIHYCICKTTYYHMLQLIYVHHLHSMVSTYQEIETCRILRFVRNINGGPYKLPFTPDSYYI